MGKRGEDVAEKRGVAHTGELIAEYCRIGTPPGGLDVGGLERDLVRRRKNGVSWPGKSSHGRE